MIDDLEYVGLPDQRLKHRLEQLVETLGGAPERSIPGACEEWRDTKAAYRFF
jgi:hypothetical protein